VIKLKYNYFIITVETPIQRQKLSSLGIIVNYNNHKILSDYHLSYYLLVYYSSTRVQLYKKSDNHNRTQQTSRYSTSTQCL